MNYLVKKKIPRLLLSFLDQLILPMRQSAEIKKLDKILLCNIAHLGDAVISTSLIPVLRQALPHTKIGFLTSGLSSCVLKDHPEVTWIHEVNHWKLNRSSASISKKIFTYYSSKRTAIEEIKRVGYDLAIDLYPYFPNAIPLLWQAGIPVRMGYTSGGFGPLLTHPMNWEHREQHISSYHYDLLKNLPLQFDKTQLSYSLPKPSCEMPNKWGLERGYLLLHMGSSTKEKDWPEDRWCRLVQEAPVKQIVFTGRGPIEKERIARVSKNIVNSINLSDQLSWKELCEVVSMAGQVVTVDSVAAHIAEAYAIPTIVIFMGSSAPIHWKPPHAIGLICPSFEELRENLESLL